MDSTSSPSLPLTSDPGLFENWDNNTENPLILSSSTHSDALEALQKVQQEAVVKRNKEGQVIQHRAWNVGEVFRSDIDYLNGITLTGWDLIRFRDLTFS